MLTHFRICLDGYLYKMKLLLFPFQIWDWLFPMYSVLVENREYSCSRFHLFPYFTI